jgi:hypothetical protein
LRVIDRQRLMAKKEVLRHLFSFAQPPRDAPWVNPVCNAWE